MQWDKIAVNKVNIYRTQQVSNLVHKTYLCVCFSAPPVTLLPEARYEQVMSAFGGCGYLVRTVEELRSALQESLNNTQMPSLLNVLIDPASDRKQQVLHTHTHTQPYIIAQSAGISLTIWIKHYLVVYSHFNPIKPAESYLICNQGL